ncbi:hypothetical protein R1flu_021104 [Riccia fluitans]|uniref:Uncharacterized protein n=1 Tax=Riccia fluitans TaxID=41844 RepID=A0ABD1ZQ08_9MARC
MNSVMRNSSCVLYGQEVIPAVVSLTREEAAFGCGLRYGSTDRKFSKLAYKSSNPHKNVQFSSGFKAKRIGRVDMCNTAHPEDIPGQQYDTDVSKKFLSAEEGLEMAELDGVEIRELLVDESTLDENGQLKEKGIATADSGSQTFREKWSSRVKVYLQLLIHSLQRLNFFRDSRKGKPLPAGVNVEKYIQFTSTELHLQHSQMVRIAQDTRYLVWSFALFGLVRIVEAVVLTFSARPIHIRKLLDASNAIEPLSVALLAHGMRQPIVAILKVDPADYEKVSQLKIKFWKELHAYFERQWKFIATLGIVRLLNLIATHHPASQYATSKLQFLWNVVLKLPVF